jgi:hypothetical protein
MKHTATPWKAKSTKTDSSFSANWREIYADNRSIVSAASYDSYNTGDDGTTCGVCISEDDANFITHACNCHEDLLKSLKLLLSDIEADPMSSAYFDLRHIKAAQEMVMKADQ